MSHAQPDPSRDRLGTEDVEAVNRGVVNLLGHVENVDALTESFKKVLAGPEGEGSLKAILDRVEKSMEAMAGFIVPTCARTSIAIAPPEGWKALVTRE